MKVKLIGDNLLKKLQQPAVLMWLSANRNVIGWKWKSCHTQRDRQTSYPWPGSKDRSAAWTATTRRDPLATGLQLASQTWRNPPGFTNIDTYRNAWWIISFLNSWWLTSQSNHYWDFNLNMFLEIKIILEIRINQPKCCFVEFNCLLVAK